MKEEGDCRVRQDDTEAVAAGEQVEPEARVVEDLDELRVKAAERDEFLELAKRTKADFSNYQRRVEEDRERWAAVAQRDLLKRMLNAIDQSRLAAESAAGDNSVESLRGALALVWSEIERFLREAGVERVPGEGQPFDPDRHEAIMVQPSADAPDSTVLAEAKPGYFFKGQVLRPAQVVVSRKIEVDGASDAKATTEE